jgi:hypothetical protein
MNNNIGFYIPYSVNDSSLTYEYINKLSMMLRNIDSSESYNNIFKWKNVFENKIMNLNFISVHFVSIPNNPWIDKIQYQNMDQNIINYLQNNQILINQNIIINRNISIQICYVDLNIIDFTINNDSVNLYSYDITNNIFYLYTRSNKLIYDEGCLYLDIDIDDNKIYTTNNSNFNFNFKLTPFMGTNNLSSSNNYTYYTSNSQVLTKSLNKLINIYTLNIKLYNSSGKLLINNNINKNISSNSICSCDSLVNHIYSCPYYYLRHPLNPFSQIDIGLKIGLVRNQLLTNVFN